MITRAVRWLLVAAVAWGLRRGVTLEQAADLIGRSFPWHDETWRSDLLETARERNRARLMKGLRA